MRKPLVPCGRRHQPVAALVGLKALQGLRLDIDDPVVQEMFRAVWELA
jgi:hypothetical protein